MYTHKKNLILKCLKEGKTSITVNGSHPDVKLPSHLQGNLEVNLSLSLKFENPTYLKDDCIETTLNFMSFPYEVSIPYDAIYCVGMYGKPSTYKLYVEDTPPAIIKKVEEKLGFLDDRDILFGEPIELKDYIQDLKAVMAREDVCLGSLENDKKKQ
jgi:hypothetical protein